MIGFSDPAFDDYLETVFGAYDGGGYEKELQAVVFASRLYDTVERPIDDTFTRDGRGVYSQAVRDYLEDNLLYRWAPSRGSWTRKFDARSVDDPKDISPAIEQAITVETEVGGDELMYNLVRGLPSLNHLSTGEPVDVAQARAEFHEFLDK